jgi:hypothetical protein
VKPDACSAQLDLNDAATYPGLGRGMRGLFRRHDRHERLRDIPRPLSRRAPPVMKKAQAHSMPTRHVRHARPWHEALTGNLRLLGARPTPTPLDPANHLDPTAAPNL